MSHRQTDQLAVAIRSPIAAQEDQHRRGVEVIRKSPRPCFLVGEREVGQHPLTIAGGTLNYGSANESDSHAVGPKPHGLRCHRAFPRIGNRPTESEETAPRAQARGRVLQPLQSRQRRGRRGNPRLASIGLRDGSNNHPHACRTGEAASHDRVGAKNGRHDHSFPLRPPERAEQRARRQRGGSRTLSEERAKGGRIRIGH